MEKTKMKHVRSAAAIILTVVAMALWHGCTSRSHREADAAMKRAETLMQQHPDSALTILQQIPREEISGKRRRALHALLLSQALDKNWIDITADTLIAPAVDYFRSTNETHYKALAYFYAGRIYFNAKNFTYAFTLLKHAASEANLEQDWLLLGNIYRELSYVYHEVGDPVEERNYSKKSLECYLKTANDEFIEYAKIEYGRTCLNNYLFDEALAYIISGLQSNAVKSDTAQYSEGLRVAATVYVGKHLPDSVIYYFESALKLDSTQMSVSNIRNMIDALVEKERLTDAKHIDTFAHKIFGDSYHTPFSIAYAEHKYKDAFLSQARDITDMTSIYLNSKQHTVTEALENYYTKASELQKRTEQAQRQRLILVFIIIILFFILLVGILLNVAHNRQKSLQIAVLKAQNINDTLFRRSNAELSTQLKINNLFQNTLKSLDELCRVYELTDDKAKAVIVAKKIKDKIKDFHGTTTCLNRFEQILNENYDNLVIRLRNDFPTLSRKMLELFIYQSMGFSTNGISLFMNEKSGNIYLLRKRLKDKIVKSDVSAKDDYLQFL